MLLVLAMRMRMRMAACEGGGRGRKAGRQAGDWRRGHAGRERAETVKAGQAGPGRPSRRRLLQTKRFDWFCGRKGSRGGGGQTARVAQHHKVDLRAGARLTRREEHL